MGILKGDHKMQCNELELPKLSNKSYNNYDVGSNNYL